MTTIAFLILLAAMPSCFLAAYAWLIVAIAVGLAAAVLFAFTLWLWFIKLGRGDWS